MPNHDGPLYYLNTETWESGIITIVNSGMQELQVTQIHFMYLFFVEIDYSALWGFENLTKNLNSFFLLHIS